MFSSSDVVRKTLDPSGNAEPSGRSVFRYSSPRRSSSCFSSAYAGDPVKSGCQDARTSCVNPGAVRSVDVRMQPAELVVALEDADVPAGLREQRGAGEGVDPGADEDRVEGRHTPNLQAHGRSRDVAHARSTSASFGDTALFEHRVAASRQLDHLYSLPYRARP